MKVTDYSRIASRYDDNELRRRIAADDLIAARLRAEPRRPLVVLDLGCGTGSYLAVQAAAYSAEQIEWHGIDASEAMLSVARGKVPGVDLRLGRAEDLPYEPGTFDYVATSFAFHHFEGKLRALAEIHRVLRPGGALRMRNIAPSLMREWWVYRYFPETVAEDDRRFWTPIKIHEELSRLGFEPSVRVEYYIFKVSWRSMLADAERRDISELSILDDTSYEAGLARIREAASRDPDGQVTSEIAVLDCAAARPAA